MARTLVLLILLVPANQYWETHFRGIGMEYDYVCASNKHVQGFVKHLFFTGMWSIGIGDKERDAYQHDETNDEILTVLKREVESQVDECLVKKE